ncbi:glycosyltransferase [Paenibacillus aceris]|uniref:Glycosyltransferase involved in cell wall biosynthesis n=1 Tax=Paenibacillus aceris TaxID=869555 RepID=A0ABS4I2U8_9BACL|nr:glycosyltransferase [Paenibacillus aceris]MBP1965207.1 glycosyltransferase involved in cell wall biosynthesis [Paenibacillus aceris]NHW33184.1 glycosyltransferase [Paenibacillus aceris]
MTKNFEPLVSIVIPVYNGSNYLREAINSALSQTYKNIEVIVINDGSIDGGKTEKIALSYGSKIKYFRKENGGVATALNFGIEKMQGEYFSWLSHDDLYTNNKILKQIEILSELEDKTTIVTGGYVVVNSRGGYLYDVDPLLNHSMDKLEKPLYSLLRGAIHGCAMLIHKSHFERVGVFDTNLPTTQDYDLFFRMLRGQKIKFHKDLNVKSRSHEEQDSKKLINAHIEECNELWIGMMQSLTPEEKCLVDGSEYLFYKNTYNFLKGSTSYDKAIIYSLTNFIDQARNEVLTNPKKPDVLLDLLDCIGITNKEFINSEYSSAVVKMKEKKRIGFLGGSLNDLGGLNRVLLNVASMLCEQFEVYFINLFGDQLSGGYDFSNEIKMINYAYGNHENSEHELAKRLKFLNIDLVVISHNCNESFLRLYPVLHQYSIKTIAWNHEFYFLPHIKEELYHVLPLRIKYLEEANVAIWLNSFSANVYALLNSNTAIMPNPVTINKTKEHDSVEIVNRPKDVVAVGRFDDDRKGFEQLIHAFALILKKIPSTKLYIVGPYDLTQVTSKNKSITYKKLIEKLNIPSSNIIFTGWTKDIAPYLMSSCVHLAPSHHEGFGLVITETASYGVPSIIFEGSGMDDLVSDGKSGFIVPMNDATEMAEKTIELLTNDELLKDMSECAKGICERYEPFKIIARWEILINAVLEMNKMELAQYLKDNFMYSFKDQQSFTKEVIREYEKFTAKLFFHNSQSKYSNQYENQNNDEIVYLTTNNIAELYRLEIEGMKSSLSWRITRPLRLFKLIMKSFKQNGLKNTVLKILVNIKKKSYRYKL